MISPTRSGSASAFDGGDELRPDEQHLRFAVVDDVRELARREPPVDRRHHRARLRGAEQQLEIEIRVLAEMRDAIARAHAERDQALRDLAGARVELLRKWSCALRTPARGAAA